MDYQNYPAPTQPYSPPITGTNSTRLSQVPQQTGPISNVVMINGGRATADQYQVGANQSVMMIDFSSRKIWIKASDSWGLPITPMREFDILECTQNPYQQKPQEQQGQAAQQQAPVAYATVDDLSEIKKMISDLAKEQRRQASYFRKKRKETMNNNDKPE